MKTAPNAKYIVKHLIRCAQKGAMASIHHESGQPYASLITLASAPSGAPLFLISKLAIHTKNIGINPHVSILIDDSDHTGNPVEGARVSLQGTAIPVQASWARARFLAYHPDAKLYVDFEDFEFYSLSTESAHFVGGFGKIQQMPSEEVIIDVSSAGTLIEAEPDIIELMNEDHQDVVQLYATRLLEAQPDLWRLVACDPAGCNISNDKVILRLDFSQLVGTPDEARQQFIELAALARQNQDK